ncbi:hypothetical protein B0H10DRAFT_1293950 [Mycena sp. CBHHK59/15]|nr:hypothetical protein B0H10DRAFT_1293950 [Mycena sp. CBHHK59/15]
MAELAALLACLPDTILEQFCDASFTGNFRTKNAQLFSDTSWVDLDDLRAWIRGRGDLDRLLDPPVSESNFPPVVGLGPDSLYGMDGSVGNTTFNTYPTVNFDRPRSATPSSGYSFHPYDDHQSSNHSRPSSEFEYLSASGISTLYSGLPLFGDNVSEPNLDWDHSLAAFFDSMDTGSGSDLSFLPPDNVSFPVLGSDQTAVASGSDMFCFHQNASHVVALNPTAFLPPPQEPQENFKFEDSNPRLMTHEEMDAAGEAWQWVRSDTVCLDQDVSSDVYIPPEPFPVTKGFKVVRIERVHGIPSQFPFPLVPTAYIVDFSSVRDSYKNEDSEMNNLDKIRTVTLGTGLLASAQAVEPPWCMASFSRASGTLLSFNADGHDRTVRVYITANLLTLPSSMSSASSWTPMHGTP